MDMQGATSNRAGNINQPHHMQQRQFLYIISQHPSISGILEECHEQQLSGHQVHIFLTHNGVFACIDHTLLQKLHHAGVSLYCDDFAIEERHVGELVPPFMSIKSIDWTIEFALLGHPVLWH